MPRVDAVRIVEPCGWCGLPIYIPAERSAGRIVEDQRMTDAAIAIHVEAHHPGRIRRNPPEADT